MKKSRIFAAIIAFFITASLICGFLYSGTDYRAFDDSDNISENSGYELSAAEAGKGIFDKILKKSKSNTSQQKFSSKSSDNTRAYVYPSGTPIGIKLYCDGVIVVGMDDITTENGLVNPAKNAGLAIGDVIHRVDGKAVTRNYEVSNAIENSEGKEMTFDVTRNSRELSLKFSSVFSQTDGRYKAGLWIRDSAAGIGTMSFVTESGAFASLGHAVCDIDTGDVMPMYTGEITGARLTGLYKGTKGTAGELCGILTEESLGIVEKNGITGIYGYLTDERYLSGTAVPVAKSSEVHNGKATVISTIDDGVTETYSVEISKINLNDTEHKNFVVHVTDSRLLEKTGGIIQGMSGSPIIQDGYLIGAVTHVFLNDPTGGYGILASTMLEMTNNISQ